MVTSFTSNVSIMIENQENNKLVKCYNTYINDEQNWGGKYNFGPLQYGSNKNFIFEFEKSLTDTNIEVFIEYVDYRNNKLIKNCHKNIESIDKNIIYENYLRSQIYDKIIKCKNDLDNSKYILEEYLASLRSFILAYPSNYISDLIKDIAGEVMLAFSTPQAYNKWGKHYVISLSNAHMNQMCNNFKDPGVQHFGGELFKKIRDMTDDIFLFSSCS